MYFEKLKIKWYDAFGSEVESEQENVEDRRHDRYLSSKRGVERGRGGTNEAGDAQWRRPLQPRSRPSSVGAAAKNAASNINSALRATAGKAKKKMKKKRSGSRDEDEGRGRPPPGPKRSAFSHSDKYGDVGGGGGAISFGTGNSSVASSLVDSSSVDSSSSTRRQRKSSSASSFSSQQQVTWQQAEEESDQVDNDGGIDSGGTRRREMVPPAEGGETITAGGDSNGGGSSSQQQMEATTTMVAMVAEQQQRHTPGPRAKPGVEISFSAGITVNLVRRNAVGESGPDGQGRWLQRSRVSIAGVRAGGVREPSDGWGTPPPQHRGWFSVVSLTVGTPPLLPSSTKGRGGGKAGKSNSNGRSDADVASLRRPARFADVASASAFVETLGVGGVGGGGRNADGSRAMMSSPSRFGRSERKNSNNDGARNQQQPPWLVCRAAAIALPSGALERAGVADGGNDRSGNGGFGRRNGNDSSSGKFLDARVAGRTGGSGGAGRSCASLLVDLGEVEAWAIGGAATRWFERLGPKVNRSKYGGEKKNKGHADFQKHNRCKM